MLEISVALKRIFQDNINEPELQLEGHLPVFIIKNVVRKGSKKKVLLILILQNI